jgi:eukaryotic-like serine/threonine-protein kinase
MKRFVKYVVSILVLVIVAMASMLITMRLAIHRREVVIPNFVGMLPQAAEQSANSMGLVLIRENRFYSEEVPEGHIVSQEPAAGIKVRKGWRIRIAESMGPQKIVIPSVIGDSPRTAELNVKRRGLELGAVAAIAMPELPPDQVVAQSPPAEAQGVATPKVSILVAAPSEEKSYVMPDLSGMRIADASAAITNAGLKVGNVATAKVDTSAALPSEDGSTPAAKPAGTPGVIVKQSPAPGQRVSSGTTVSLEVTPAS